MTEAEQALRIIASFVIGLLIVYITAKAVGEKRKAEWFRKRRRTTIFTRRGMLGEACHFGVPCKWQGAVICAVMFGSIGMIGYFVIFIL